MAAEAIDPLKRITIDNLSVAACDAPPGDEPPVLLIHGIFGGAWYLEGYQRHFSSLGISSYALDLRGHHTSRPVDDLGKVRIADYVEDVSDAFRWIREKHAMAPVVIGHSMGGLVAQKFAEGETPAGLVLISPAPPRGVPLINPKIALRQVKYLPKLLMSKVLEGTPQEHIDTSMNRMAAELRMEVAMRFVPDSGRAAREMSLGSVSVDAAKVRCPVVCIAGLDDLFIPPRITRRVARRYLAPFWRYPQHAHFFVMEPGWEKPVEDITKWIRHITQLRSDPLFVAEFWQNVNEQLGQVVDLTFFDDRRVRGEIVKVDKGLRRGVRYRFLELLQAGSVPFVPPARGAETRAALQELKSLTAV